MALYFCGWNGCGQVGGQPSIISEPTCLKFDGIIVTVSCSWSVLVVATDQTFSVMGFIGNQSNVSKCIELHDNSKAVKVSSCLKHTLIASSNGICYDFSSEANKLKQLINFTSSESTNEESGCTEDDPIIKVSCSDYINLAVSKLGRVFAIPSHINLPELIVTEVSCGNEHNILVTSAGSVFTWGESSRGQLGHGDLEPEESPRLVETLAGIEVNSISAGGWHNAVVTSTGDLYTWGWGCEGQLGVDENADKSTEEGENPGGKKLKIDQELSGHPENDNKYRGIVQTYPVPIDTPCDVTSVSCGSRHTIVLLVDGSVWGCGWNAYGQLACSPNSCLRSITLRKINIPGLTGKVSKIECGGWSSCFIL